MTTQGREQLTTKYRGIYDKAMSGHSKTAGIHANCLICLACDTKAIRTCDNTDCPLWPYRPYQEKSKTPRTRKIEPKFRDEKGRLSKRTGGAVSKDIVISNAPEGKLRVRVVIEPEREK